MSLSVSLAVCLCVSICLSLILSTPPLSLFPLLQPYFKFSLPLFCSSLSLYLSRLLLVFLSLSCHISRFSICLPPLPLLSPISPFLSLYLFFFPFSLSPHPLSNTRSLYKHSLLCFTPVLSYFESINYSGSVSSKNNHCLFIEATDTNGVRLTVTFYFCFGC